MVVLDRLEQHVRTENFKIRATCKQLLADKCECASFFLGDVKDESRVYSVPDTKLDDCDVTEPCKKACETTFRKLTNNGDLQHVTSRGLTVAQLSCKTYRKNITNGILAAHYRACGGAWELAVSTNEKLCCKGGEVDTSCVAA